MEIEKIIHQYGKKQSFSDTVHMLLANNIDYGCEKGGLISVKKYPVIETSIMALMKMAWEHGFNACTCEKCDFCIEQGPDTFERFIEEFPSYC